MGPVFLISYSTVIDCTTDSGSPSQMASSSLLLSLSYTHTLLQDPAVTDLEILVLIFNILAPEGIGVKHNGANIPYVICVEV